MTIQVYGIPNCGTCKKAFQWLKAQGVDYQFVNTRENPPTREMVQGWVDTLGSKPLRNTSGQSYRALGEVRNTWTDTQWIDAFAQDVMLLKRPLFVRDGQAVLAGFRAKEEEIRAKLGIA